MKKKNSKFASLTLLVLLASLASLHGAFENVGSGGRPTGMANAFTAIGGDVHAMYFNPAGLGTLTHPELSSMYSQLFMGLSDKSDLGVVLLGYGHPLGPKGQWGTLGVGIWRLRLESLFSEQSVHLAYGRSLMKLGPGKLYLGSVAKWLARSFGSTPETLNAINLSGTALGSPDPVLARRQSKNAASLDLGAFYKYKIYSLGLAVNNINEPNMALNPQDSDRVPMTTRLGFSLSALKIRFALDAIRKEAIEGRYDHTFALGAERAWAIAKTDALVLRAGFAYGDRKLRNISAGIGYQFHRAVFNYAFQIPLSGIEKTDGSHALSLSVRFGRMVIEEDIERLLEAEKEARTKAELALKEAETTHEDTLEKIAKIEQDLSGLRQTIALEQQVQEKTRLENQQRLLEETARLEEEKRILEARGKEISTKEIAAREAAASAFRLSWDYYQKRVETGADYNERLKILADIKTKYAGKPVDLGPVDKEISTVRKDQEQAQKDFDLSWTYYQQLSASGVSDEAKLELLSRMVKKFSDRGVELKNVKEEIEKLRKGR